MGCGKLLGEMKGYRKICGRVWCGEIALCDECKEKINKKKKTQNKGALKCELKET